MSKKSPPKPATAKRSKKSPQWISIRTHQRKMKELMDEADDARNAETAARSRQDKIHADYKVQIDALKRDIEFWKHHRNTMVSLIKNEWCMVLDRLGVSMHLTTGQDMVEFTKGTMILTLRVGDVLEHGMHTIVQMFCQVPGQGTVFNVVDNNHGWKHPDVIKNDKEVAIEKAAKLLKAAGFKQFEEVKVTVPSDEE